MKNLFKTMNWQISITRILKAFNFNIFSILISFSIYSCTENNNSEQQAVQKPEEANIPIESNEILTDNNSINLNEFGMSFKVPEKLSILQKNYQFATTLVAHGATAESGEIVLITPSIDNWESYAAQLQNSNFEIDYDNYTANLNSPELGMNLNTTYISSPNGGGLLVMYIIKNDLEPTISTETRNEIVKSVKHFSPTWTYENRLAFFQQQQVQQQQLSDQEKLQKLRSEHRQNQFDLQMLQLENQLGN
jgi:hypothetical protein